jgi:hypothetical protein
VNGNTPGRHGDGISTQPGPLESPSPIAIVPLAPSFSFASGAEPEILSGIRAGRILPELELNRNHVSLDGPPGREASDDTDGRLNEHRTIDVKATPDPGGVFQHQREGHVLQDARPLADGMPGGEAQRTQAEFAPAWSC